ncbi:MAG: alpha/beta hydrolase [Sulfurimonadaceae bacterium]|nr:alpha/beta hydrolase [Sulfurimonadaceae bacterium]
MLELIKRFLEGHRRRRNRIVRFLFVSFVALGVYGYLYTGDRSFATQYPVPEHWKSSYTKSPYFDKEVFIVQSGMQHDRTVLLVHGLGHNASKDWLNVIPALEKQFHVIALDLPGFGRSHAENGSFTPGNYARLLHQIRSDYGKEETIIVGHSMGGAITLRYAADFSDDITKVVLVDVAGVLERTAYVKHIADIPFKVDDAPDFLKRLTTGFENFSTAIIEWVNLLPDPVNVIHVVNTYWNDSGLNASQANIAMEMIREDYSKVLRNVSHPTYILWGEQDRVAPLRTAKVLTKRLPNAALHTFADAGHVPMTSHPKLFNEALLSALSDVPTAVDEGESNQNHYGSLNCSGETGTVYSGIYDEIIIEQSKAVKFIDVKANRIVVRNSTVEFENLEVLSDTTAFEAISSVVLMTNATIAGSTSLHSEGSRIDMAGVSLKGQDAAVRISTKSRLIFSVSDLQSNHYLGHVHGDYRIKKSGIFDRSL